MLEEVIVRTCSPTLAGLKTGNIFCAEVGDETKLRENIRSLNKRLGAKGVRIIPLRFRNSRALIYVYRSGKLKEDLSDALAVKLLHDFGYDPVNSSRCIGCLKQRINEQKDFPHEIGLFIGYPPEDVSGFIENKAAGCKYTGCWKVYGDEAKARSAFRKFKKCTSVYMEKWKSGTPLEKLTVAV